MINKNPDELAKKYSLKIPNNLRNLFKRYIEEFHGLGYINVAQYIIHILQEDAKRILAKHPELVIEDDEKKLKKIMVHIYADFNEIFTLVDNFFLAKKPFANKEITEIENALRRIATYLKFEGYGIQEEYENKCKLSIQNKSFKDK